jgi:hypothetical protein
MGWAASKAVGQVSRRRAKARLGCSSEWPAVAIRGILLADVLAHLLPFEPHGRYRVTASPQVLAGEISFLAAQARNRDRDLPF